MEWLFLFAVLGVGWAMMRSRPDITPGSEVEAAFDLVMPAKTAADLMEARLADQGLECERWEEEEDGEWACKVCHVLPFDIDRLDEIQARYHAIAAEQSGYCMGYTVQRGDVVEIYMDDDEAELES